MPTRKEIEEMKKSIAADDVKNDAAIKQLTEAVKLAQASSAAAKKAKADLAQETD